MSTIICKDADGNLLKTFYQWDSNQCMIVSGVTMPPVPVFHFCNRKSDRAFVVSPIVSGNDLVVSVPNVLLQSAEPLIAYLYGETGDDGYRTTTAIHIPVTPRPMPDDYEYTENIDYVSIAILDARISSLLETITGESINDPIPEVRDIRIGYDGVTYDSAGDAVRAVGHALDDLRDELLEYIDENAVSNLGLQYDEPESMLYLTNNGEIISDGVRIVSGSGGGGSGNNAWLTVSNTTGWLAKTISLGSNCPLSFSWSSIENELATGDGILSIKIGGVEKKTFSISQGNVEIDVGQFLVAGSNKVRITVTDVYENQKSLNFTITTIALSITSTFDTSSIFPSGTSVLYTYTPIGAVNKTVHFIVDGVSVGSDTIISSGRQQTYTLPGMLHGAHSLRVYFTALINEEVVVSNELYYDLVVVDPSSITPIISSSFVLTSSTQYTTLFVPYRVYTPNSITSEVTLSVNDTEVSTLTVDRTEQIWSYRADTAGTLTLKISSGTVSRSFIVNVAESEIDVSAETDSLALYLSSRGRSNNEMNPGVWVDNENDVSCTLTGFNFTSDGWVTDSDGVTALRVSGDARVSIPYKIFSSDFRSTGKTIEVEFATRGILDYDAVIMSCMSGDCGFQLTAQKAELMSEQSAISTQYKEDEHVRVSFVIEKRMDNRLIYIYINGIMSGVVQYPSDDNFAQANPVDISIGSNYCTTDIYCIRVYDNNLTRYQILDNWIADTQDIASLIPRYERNNVYDEYGSVSIEKLPNDLPYMVIVCPELPQYKGDKKTISGYYVDPTDESKSFSFTGAQADVQGTSSQYYPRKNYKIKFKNGFTMTSTGTNVPTFAMRGDNSIPTDTFTFKADVASSEGANNVELVRLYNESCPYKTPPQIEDNRIRQGIDGFPIVMFWNDGNETTFLGKANFNNDKGTDEVFGFEDGDESWEIKNNTSNRVIWKSADYSSDDWLNDFEGRYPEENTDATNLSALAAWLVSTDQRAATEDDLLVPVTYNGITYMEDTAAYRLAKFKNEFEDHFEKDSAIFYYLFTELFLMVDSRAKNAFPSFLSGDKWCFLPYDFDTAIGINNEGSLAFDYSLEDIDTTESGADVFNGQQSVLWVNLRQAFFDDIKAMYQNLRSTGKLSYSKVENMFEEHQGKWCEAIFNEDAWFKYINPLTEDGSGAYLAMAQGSKAEQRKWWLYNRFRYLDSKYNAGDALTDVIQVRGYAKDDITVTPYANIYPSVKYGSYLVSERGSRNISTTLVNPLDSVNDTEIYIYSASQLSSVGDLSGLKVGFADFSMATRLQNIKVGSDAVDYTNGNLTEFYVGNNKLLNTVDVRNCTALTGAVDLSGCTNIEYVFFDGTAITSCALPNGGILKTLSLPETITNLTIRNQSSISTFNMPSYSNITTLRLENTPEIPVERIIKGASSLNRVRLIGMEWESTSEANLQLVITRLSSCNGLDENGNNTPNAVVSGRVYVESISQELLATINTLFPDLIVVVDSVPQYVVRFMNTNNTLVYAMSVPEGGDAIDPIAAGLCDPPTIEIVDTQRRYYSFVSWETIPTNVHSNITVFAQYREVFRVRYVDWDDTVLKTMYVNAGQDVSYNGILPVRPSTAQYSYEFIGWSGSQTNIQDSHDIVATYSATVRKYTVRFFNGSTLLQTSTNIEYGSSAEYTGVTPQHQDLDYLFTGFVPDGTNITGDTDCIAQFAYMSGPLKKYLEGTLTSYESENIANISSCSFYGMTSLETVTVSANTIGPDAFNGCTNLATVDLTSLPRVAIYANAFAGCSSLDALFIRSSQVAILMATSAFSQTPIARAWGCIYVPDNLVDSYRSATNWSNFSDKIYPISSYPNFDFSSITDSWSEIFAAEQDGTYLSKYNIGDTKMITVSSNGTDTDRLLMEIVAFDADTLANENGTAKITWVCKHRYVAHAMNSSSSNTGGWASCEMRTWLRETIYPTIPSEIRSGIKEVVKTYSVYNGSEMETQSVNDTIWIPSLREKGRSDTNAEDSGPAYSQGMGSKGYYNTPDSTGSWWLRTSYSNISQFYYVNYIGNISNSSATTNSTVVFGFCT